MGEVDSRVAAWAGFIGDLLQEPFSEMPHDRLFDQLQATFRFNAVSYNWSQPDGRVGVLIRPQDVFQPKQGDIEDWQRAETGRGHPLITWYRRTGDARPNTCERVPNAVVSVREREPTLRWLHSVQLEQQLAINFRLGRGGFRTYVLARDGTDFNDDDLEVARQVQRAIIGLDRHTTLIRQLSRQGHASYVDAGLTAREFAVLALLAAGHSTSVIAHRLQCSPRTVNKHLERVFRKLGVRDRVNAIRMAQFWGLI